MPDILPLFFPHLEVPNADKFYLNNSNLNLTSKTINSSVDPNTTVANTTVSTTVTTTSSSNTSRNFQKYLCFSNPNAAAQNAHQSIDLDETILPSIPEISENITGWNLLPYSISTFIRCLKDCENEKTIEASLAVIQNLSSGDWIWSSYTRNVVRKDLALEKIISFIKKDCLFSNDSLIIGSG